ncbi:MAG: substrate-binding domain-containing protein [Capsulimonadaceae bacterium]|nr:substrate-binding domain-containing protein [Capsulimonadaceae bacterium]
MASVTAQKRSQESTGKYKYEKLRSLLDDHIEHGNAGDPLPSYSQLLKDHNVRRNTADRVLQELVAEERIVRVHGKGIFISARAKQKTIALVFGDTITRVMSTTYPKVLVDSCAAYAREKGHRLFIYYGVPRSDGEAESEPELRSLANAIRAKEIDGIIYCAHGGSEEQLLWLASQGVVVATANELPSALRTGNYASVRIDWRQLIRRGVDALVGQSCREIGLINNYCTSGEQGIEECPEASYFLEALQDHALTCSTDWVWDRSTYLAETTAYTVSDLEARGFQALSDLWARRNAQGRHIEGIVVTDDFMTRGCLFAAYALGIKIGRDVQIATHANRGSDALSRFQRDLTLLEVDMDVLAGELIRTLTTMMEGKPYKADRLLNLPDIVCGRSKS